MWYHRPKGSIYFCAPADWSFIYLRRDTTGSYGTFRLYAHRFKSQSKILHSLHIMTAIISNNWQCGIMRDAAGSRASQRAWSLYKPMIIPLSRSLLHHPPNPCPDTSHTPGSVARSFKRHMFDTCCQDALQAPRSTRSVVVCTRTCRTPGHSRAIHVAVEYNNI
jgi:hypothetical protein